MCQVVEAKVNGTTSDLPVFQELGSRSQTRPVAGFYPDLNHTPDQQLNTSFLKKQHVQTEYKL